MKYETRTVDLTVSEAAYGAADQVNDIKVIYLGKATTALLKNITIIDKQKASPQLEFLFFSEDPANTSADNAALSFPDTSKLLAVVAQGTPAYLATALSSVQTLTPNVVLTPEGAGENVYMLVRITSTTDFTAGQAVSLKLGLELTH